MRLWSPIDTAKPLSWLFHRFWHVFRHRKTCLLQPQAMHTPPSYECAHALCSGSRPVGRFILANISWQCGSVCRFSTKETASITDMPVSLAEYALFSQARASSGRSVPSTRNLPHQREIVRQSNVFVWLGQIAVAGCSKPRVLRVPAPSSGKTLGPEWRAPHRTRQTHTF